ncbi:MAG: carboxypeptidase regulatory-like domain-containing protein [Sedimentisphaerales bacterium]|nr:carboxypeptidase regulatory-like domain-containing protein [Sedimentisphaerales bacterium]
MRNYCKTFIIFYVILFTGNVFGIQGNIISEIFQTKINEPQERIISLKLPLTKPYLNWTFMSKEDFLSGKLVLHITRGNETQEMVIFDNGQLSDEWKENNEQQIQGGEIYFGFISAKKHLTAQGDKLKLELIVKKDLPGIGELQSGILPVGTYKTEGTYSALLDEYDSQIKEQLSKNGEITEQQQKALDIMKSHYNNKAFMDSWQEQWPVKITSEKGWLPEEQAVTLKVTLKQLETLQEQLKNIQSNQERPKTSKTEPKIENTTKISGTVYDEKGEPVSDALVTVPLISEFKGSKTDNDGKFLINVNLERAGVKDFHLLARHKERNLAAIKQIEDSNDNLNLMMLPGVTLSSKVVDPNGSGIQNAKIEPIIWFSNHGGNWNESVEINEKGNFQINALPAGFSYTIIAQADGFGRDDVNIQTSQTPGDKYVLEPMTLKVANLSVSGFVVDENDKPVAKAEILLQGNSLLTRYTVTDRNGKFTIDKIAEGEFRIEADIFETPRLSGHVRAKTGSTNVKIVVSEVDSSGRPVQDHSLINKPLPRIESLFPGFKPEKIRDKNILVCFWDYEQRPSRNSILQLAKQTEKLKEKDIEIIAIQASKIELAPLDKWIQENNITFTIGVIPSDHEKTQFDWGVKSLPWLILTDKYHKVIAEGFGIAELDEKLGTN